MAERENKMACSVCGCYSSAITCWNCTQVINGSHPAVQKLKDEIEKLKEALKRIMVHVENAPSPETSTEDIEFARKVMNLAKT